MAFIIKYNNINQKHKTTCQLSNILMTIEIS